MPQSTVQKQARRRRVGAHAGLNLARIIEVARSMEPATLTMQALAKELGVDPKALNHHVKNRETLLGLVALDVFSTAFSSVNIATKASWQEACRCYAQGFTESVMATGTLSDRIRMSSAIVSQVLEPTEVVLRAMVEAGFDDEGAMRTLSLLTNICLAYARDIAYASQSGELRRPAILRKAMEENGPAKFQTLARIDQLEANTYDKAQLEVSIELFIAGAEALLARRQQ